MKTVTALIAATVLLAGCSGSGPDDKPAPRPTKTSADASQKLERSALAKQVEEQAAQREAALQEIEQGVEPAAESAVVKIVIGRGKVSPQGGRIEVRSGQQITLTVTSDVDEEIHVHSDPEHTFQIKAGGALTETFTIDTPGQVAVEAHHAGVTIVQLVVRP